MSRLELLGCGTLAVDEILTLEAFPAPDGKTRVLHRERRAGGLTGTALVAASRLGARCGYAGVLGTDADSVFLREVLAGEGIDLSGCRCDPAAHPFHGTVLVVPDSGLRTILSQQGESGAAALDDLPQAEVVLVDHHTPERALPAIEMMQRQGGASGATCSGTRPMGSADRGSRRPPDRAPGLCPHPGRRHRSGPGAAGASGAATSGWSLRPTAHLVPRCWSTADPERSGGLPSGRAQYQRVRRRLPWRVCRESAARAAGKRDCLRRASAAAALHASVGAPPDARRLESFLIAHAFDAAVSTPD